MNFEPQTYEELIRMKRCVELTKYYEVTEEELWEIYHFLEQEPEAFIKGGRQNLSLIIGQNTAKTQKVIMANCTGCRGIVPYRPAAPRGCPLAET